MSKKRVYELAKEVGLENKELISRLEKIGITVRSHSGTLDDSDLEKIQLELHSPDHRELVEQRIKSTVIRRRAVRLPAEETKPGEAAKPPKEESPVPPEVPHMEAIPNDAPQELALKEVPVRTSIYRDRPAVYVVPKPVVQKKAVPQQGKPDGPVAKIVTVKPKALAADPKTEPTKKPSPEAGPKAPMAEKQLPSVRPLEHREGKPSQIQNERKPQIPTEEARPTPPFPRKEFPARPDLNSVKCVEMLPPMDKAPRTEEEKPKKKEGKAPIDVLMGKTAAPRKRSPIRKLDRKRRKRIEVEHGEEKPSKWRDERKVAPMGIMAEPGLPTRGGINNWYKALFPAIAIALRKLKGSIQAYLSQIQTR
jgi:translation initiation factor IF-2